MSKSKKYLPVLVVGVALLATLAPFSSVSISGPDPLLVQAALSSFPHPATTWGAFYPLGLTFSGWLLAVTILAGVLAMIGLRRWLAITMAVVALPAALVLPLVGKGYFRDKLMPGSVLVSSHAGLGFYGLIIGFFAAVVLGFYSAAKPEQA